LIGAGLHEKRRDWTCLKPRGWIFLSGRPQTPSCAAGAVDDIDLQLLEFGDALVDALVPYPDIGAQSFFGSGNRSGKVPVAPRFLEAEAARCPIVM